MMPIPEVKALDSPGADRPTRRSGPSSGTEFRSGRTLLLGCGIISSLLYAATDRMGGLLYAGYDFGSQAVSELMAVGAPSEVFVDPLFIAYGFLLLAFGAGVYGEGVGRSGGLRVAGVLLMTHAALGLTGPTLFEMHPRGTAQPADDVPHLVLTGILVLLNLAAIGFASGAFSRAFRVYSFSTVVLLMVLGAGSAPYGARMAAGEPTPGFGIVERVLIYANLLWIGVLAAALLRRPRVGVTGPR